MTTDTTASPNFARALQSVLEGSVRTAGDPAYDRGRTPYFEHWIGRPLAVVQPRDAADVAATIDFARGSGVELAVRSGGHSSHSTGDGILLDLGTLDDIDLDLPSHTVWAGAGLTAGALTRVLSRHREAVGFGDTTSVGIGGLTLGGGVGYLSRRDGLTIDNLQAAEIVTADGQIRIIDAHRDPDLFWAIRGGGGNFGVVTRFRYQLRPTSWVHGGVLVLPATVRAITRLATALSEASEMLSAIVTIMPAPPLSELPPQVHGRLVAIARVCYSGPCDAGTQALAPLRAAATPYADLLRPMPYANLLDRQVGSRGARVAVRTMFLDHLDSTTAATALQLLSEPGPQLRLLQFRILGGAIDRLPTDATAYAHRTCPIMVTAVHSGLEDRSAALGWVDTLATRLFQGYTGAYVGFIGPDDAHRADAAYPGETLATLRRIKAAYDPTNLFRGNVNVAPDA